MTSSRRFGLRLLRNPCLQSDQRDANAAADVDGRKVAAGEELIHLRPANPKGLGNFDGSQKQLIHAVEYGTHWTADRAFEYTLSMPTKQGRKNASPSAWDGLGRDGAIDLAPALPLASLRFPEQVVLLEDALGIRQGSVVDPRRRKVSPGLLDDFAGLNAPAEVRAFAQKWGSLDLCEHARPFQWHPQCQPKVVSTKTFRGIKEPLALWRLTIDAARAALRIGIACREDRFADPSDCLALDRWISADVGRQTDLQEPRLNDGTSFYERRFHNDWSDSEFRSFQRGWLADRLNHWLVRGEVGPFCSWDKDRLEIGFFTHSRPEGDVISLLGALGMQLAFAVAGAEGVTTCTACGKPFFAQRQRATSRDRYCRTCGRDAAVRAAKRRYNAKLKAERLQSKKTTTRRR